MKHAAQEDDGHKKRHGINQHASINGNGVASRRVAVIEFWRKEEEYPVEILRLRLVGARERRRNGRQIDGDNYKSDHNLPHSPMVKISA